MPEQDSGAASSAQAVGRAIGRGAAVIISLSLLDKLLAVVKEVLTAQRFGVSAQMDAFNIAYAYPGIINLLFNSACIAAFVPLVVSWRAEEDRRGPARDKILTLLYGSCLFFALLAMACHLLAPLALSLAGYGFSPGALSLSIDMEKWLVWLILLEGAGLIQAALLQSGKRFAMLTIAQTLINAAIIAFLACAPGLGIDALIQGFLGGTLLKVLAMSLGLKGMGIRPLSPFRPDMDALREFVRLAAPFLGSALIANSNILIDQSMSTVLPAGGVAVLRYAYRVNDLPLQVMVMALAKAIFPFISEQAARGDRQGLTDVFRLSLAGLLLISIPITLYVMVFADDIVDVLLRRGAFNAEAARMTALTLRCYSLGLLFHAYTFINAAFFSALRLGGVLMRLGVVTLALNWGFNWLFLRLMHGPQAIALSTTATMAIVSAVFLRLLVRRMGRECLAGLWRDLLLVLAAACASAGACLALRGVALGWGLPPLAVFGVLTFVFGGISIFVLVRFRTGETGKVLDLALRRAGRSRNVP